MLAYYFLVIFSVLFVGIHCEDNNVEACMKQGDQLAKCCVQPENNSEESKKVMEICEKLLKEGEGADAQFCFAECAFAEVGVFANNEFNETRMIEEVEKEFEKHQNEEVKERMTTTIKLCLDQIKNAERGDRKCNQQPLILAGCMKMVFDMICPESLWKNDDECSQVKAKFEAKNECEKK